MGVPVVVLAGFLGAGKTTVLNHLLRTASGVRLGVVVNDFGAVNVDALLVSGFSDTTLALQNGCLCCALDDDGDLDALLGTLTDPAAGLDAVVVEASGLAEPGVLVPLIAGAPGVAWGGLVLVADAVELESTAQHHPEMLAHLAAADVVLLTKTDLADGAAAERLCRSVNPTAPIIPVVDGALDPRLLLDPELLAIRAAEPRQLALGETVDHGTHLHAEYQSVELVTQEPLDAGAVLTLLRERPPGLFRAKGFLDLGAGHRYVLQVVGRQVRLTEGVPPGVRGSQVVCIGTGMDGDDVRARWAACVGGSDEAGLRDARVLAGAS